jgi:hypothetical protein
MLRRFSFTLAATAAAGLTFGATAASAAPITYVDAVEGSGGNTYATGGSLSNTDWVQSGTADDSTDWGQRSFANNATIFEGRYEGGGGDTDVPLTTELTGLADGTYEIWAFFWANDADSHNWDILAGLDSGSLTKYDRDGDATAGIDASTLDFTNSPMTSEDGSRIMYGANLGEATVTDGSVIDIFIDADGPATSGQGRTWYDGVGYAIPEPASLALMGLGGLMLLPRRKRA